MRRDTVNLDLVHFSQVVPGYGFRARLQDIVSAEHFRELQDPSIDPVRAAYVRLLINQGTVAWIKHYEVEAKAYIDLISTSEQNTLIPTHVPEQMKTTQGAWVVVKANPNAYVYPDVGQVVRPKIYTESSLPEIDAVAGTQPVSGNPADSITYPPGVSPSAPQVPTPPLTLSPEPIIAEADVLTPAVGPPALYPKASGSYLDMYIENPTAAFTFSEALELMTTRDIPVRRSMWPVSDFVFLEAGSIEIGAWESSATMLGVPIVQFRKGDPGTNTRMPYFHRFNDGVSFRGWVPSLNDILACDWHVYKN